MDCSWIKNEKNIKCQPILEYAHLHVVIVIEYMILNLIKEVCITVVILNLVST